MLTFVFIAQICVNSTDGLQGVDHALQASRAASVTVSDSLMSVNAASACAL